MAARASPLLRLLLLLPTVTCLHLPASSAAPRRDACATSSPQLSRRWALGGLSGLLATAPLAVDLRAASAAAPARAPPNALCDSCVSVVRTARQEITLVGTAHISEDSALLVQRVLRQVKPDTVMIELDASRAGKLLGSRPAAGNEAGNDASRAPPMSIGSLAGRVLRGDLQEGSPFLLKCTLGQSRVALTQLSPQRDALT